MKAFCRPKLSKLAAECDALNVSPLYEHFLRDTEALFLVDGHNSTHSGYSFSCSFGLNDKR